jgi:hypothetical protein
MFLTSRFVGQGPVKGTNAVATPEHTHAGAEAATVPAADTQLMVIDRARSIWRRAPSQPAHAARLRSADRFLPNGSTSSADGGWWELAPGVQIITPAMFGCGPAVADNAPGLTDFYAYLETFSCTANHEGLYPVQGNVIMGTAANNADNAENNCSTILGRLTLDVTAPISGAVITNRMKRGTKIEGIAIAGGGSLVYANKLFDIGLLFEGSAQMQNIEHLQIAYARLFGVFLRGHGTNNNVFGNNFETAYIYGCGSGCEDSGPNPAPAGAFLEAAYSTLTPGGASGAFYQTTTFQLKPGFSLPPQAVDTYGMVSFVRVGGEEFPVVSYDRTANSVTVWGWVPNGTPASNGTIKFVFGGGWGSSGGDAGIQVGHLTVSASAIGHQNSALYPAVMVVTMQHNYIGQTVGSSPAGASVGGATFGYFEGNNADIWFLGSPESDGTHYRVVADQALSLSKVRYHSGRKSDGSKVHSDKPKGLTLSYRSEDHRFAMQPDVDGAWNIGHFAPGRPHRVTALRGDSATIGIPASPIVHDGGTTSADFTRLFGYRSQEFTVTGTGTDGAPTGSVTVARGTSGDTINGVAANLTLSGFTGVARILIEKDPASSTNFLVNLVGGKPSALPGDASFNTVSVPAGLDKGLVVSGSGSIRGYGGELYVCGGYVRTLSQSGTTMSVFTPQGQVQFPLMQAGSTGPLVRCDSGLGNNLVRDTSSIRYKTDVEDVEGDYVDAFLELRPVWYRSTCEGDDPARGYWGFIAEEVAETDPRLVHFTFPDEAFEETEVDNGDGTVRRERVLKPGSKRTVPESVAYERMTVLLHALAKRQHSEIEALEEELCGLAARVEKLESKR